MERIMVSMSIPSPGKRMELLVIYDNEFLRVEEGLKTEWGFSCLIDNGEERILFDTGGDGDILLGNMKALQIDPSTIDKVVISHEHWDHNGGLTDLFHLMDNVEIFDLCDRDVPQGFIHSRVLSKQKIAKGILTTGMLPGEPLDEQSLILKGKEGNWVLTGCSHPGLENILKVAGEEGKITGIIGGLHGFDDLEMLKDMAHIHPMHCTVKKDDILREFPTTAVKSGIGTRIMI